MNPSNESSSARTRRLKKQMRDIIDRHRSEAFEQAAVLVARDNPQGRSYVRWFEEAWIASLKP